MTDRPDRRRHRRIPARVPVTLTGSAKVNSFLTEDISYSGIFVRTDTPAPLRQLVRFRFTTPDTEETLQMLAMTVYTVSKEQSERFGRTPGMGMNLYGLDDETRQGWWNFVDRATALHDAPDPDEGTLKLAGPDIDIEPIRRDFPRVMAEFKVRLQATADLYDVLTHDISLGGTFLRTGDLLPHGTDVRLTIVHPDDNSEFPVEGKVVRSVEKPTERRGIGIRFEALDADRQNRFKDFIETGIPVEDLEDDLVVEDDDTLLM